MHRADLGHASLGELAALADLLVLDVQQHALDRVADLLHVDGEADDVGPAPAFLLVELLARDLGQVVLDGRVQPVHGVVHLAQVLRQLQVVGPDDRHHAAQHGLDHVGLVQRLARRAGNGQRGRGQCGRVEVVGAVERAAGVLQRQQLLDPARHRTGQSDEDQSDHEVEAQVKEHGQCGRVRHVGLHEAQPERDERRCDQHAQCLEQQIAQRHLARGAVGLGGGEHRQQAAAQVGAQHQPERHVDADHVDRQRRGQQHHRQAGVREHRQRRADQYLQHAVAGQRFEHQLHRRIAGEHMGGFADQLQRQQHQTQPDEHAADVADLRALAQDEQRYADEDEQRREPGQVEGEHHRHHGGADVGAEHDRQRRRQQDQSATDKGGDDEGGGGARLHQGGDPQTRERGGEAVAHAGREHLAQPAAQHAQHAGAHQVGSPDQQRDGRQQIEQVFHVWRGLYAGGCGATAPVKAKATGPVRIRPSAGPRHGRQRRPARRRTPSQRRRTRRNSSMISAMAPMVMALSAMLKAGKCPPGNSPARKDQWKSSMSTT